METTDEIHRAGWVVELCNQIELYMKAIIEAFVAPRADREVFFRAYLLNNAIVPFAAKMKVVLAINNELKLTALDTNAFHTVMKLRNAFAHNDLISGIRVEEQKGVPLEPRVVLESIEGSGVLKEISRDEAFRNFIVAHKSAEASLKVMLGKLRGSRP